MKPDAVSSGVTVVNPLGCEINKPLPGRINTAVKRRRRGRVPLTLAAARGLARAGKAWTLKDPGARRYLSKQRSSDAAPEETMARPRRGSEPGSPARAEGPERRLSEGL